MNSSISVKKWDRTICIFDTFGLDNLNCCRGGDFVMAKNQLNFCFLGRSLFRELALISARTDPIDFFSVS